MQPVFEIFEQGFPALQEGSQSAIWKENNPPLGEGLGQREFIVAPLKPISFWKNEWPVLNHRNWEAASKKNQLK